MKLLAKSKNFFDVLINIIDLVRVIICLLATKKGRKNDLRKETTEGDKEQ